MGTNHLLVEAGLEACRRAEAEHALGVRDVAGTPNFDRIQRYVSEGVGDTWITYDRDGEYQWCGAFVAWCWMALHKTIRFRLLQSTRRLWHYAHYLSDEAWWPLQKVCIPGVEHLKETHAWHRDTGQMRRAQHPTRSGCFSWLPRQGDIATVYQKPGKLYGKHIVLVEAADKDRGVLLTWEGNAVGFGPQGEIYEGVVRNERPLAQVQMVIRPSIHDLRQDVRYVR